MKESRWLCWFDCPQITFLQHHQHQCFIPANERRARILRYSQSVDAEEKRTSSFSDEQGSAGLEVGIALYYSIDVTYVGKKDHAEGIRIRLQIDPVSISS